VKIMEYKSVEYVFNLDKFIDKDDKYHLWIISFAIALQDLTTINKILYNRIKSGESRNMYFFKLCIGHLREAFNLIRKAFNDEEIKKHLVQIDGIQQMYQEIVKINDGESEDSFGKAVLFEIRNNIFHYSDEEKDFAIIKDTLNDMYRSGFVSRIKLCNPSKTDMFTSDYIFAEEIQLNVFEKLGLNYKNRLDVKELFDKLIELTMKIIRILELIIDDFIARTPKEKFNYIIKTR